MEVVWAMSEVSPLIQKVSIIVLLALMFSTPLLVIRRCEFIKHTLDTKCENRLYKVGKKY